MLYEKDILKLQDEKEGRKNTLHSKQIDCSLEKSTNLRTSLRALNI
jgi:hypothetical protein